jgi:hypothetical protein
MASSSSHIYNKETASQNSTSSSNIHNRLRGEVNQPPAITTSQTSRRKATTKECKPLTHAELKELMKWLPLPPIRPTQHGQIDFLDYFVVGHQPGAYKGVIVCLKCL